MTVQLEDLLEGTKVSVTWTAEDGAEVTKEGAVVAANPTMLLIKPRGAMLGELIHAANIVSLTELTEVKKIVVRKLRILEIGEARQHLVDRHGLELSDSNLTNERWAFDYHASLDHTNLSHQHEDKSDTERVEAIEAALAESDED